MKIERFTSELSDFGGQVFNRAFKGRITKKRRKVIEKAVRKYNEEHRYPYGVSPNGYGYSCGHSHDCCGCLVSDFADIAVISHNEIFISIVKTYNF